MIKTFGELVSEGLVKDFKKEGGVIQYTAKNFQKFPMEDKIESYKIDKENKNRLRVRMKETMATTKGKAVKAMVVDGKVEVTYETSLFMQNPITNVKKENNKLYLEAEQTHSASVERLEETIEKLAQVKEKNEIQVKMMKEEEDKQYEKFKEEIKRTIASLEEYNGNIDKDIESIKTLLSHNAS